MQGLLARRHAILGAAGAAAGLVLTRTPPRTAAQAGPWEAARVLSSGFVQRRQVVYAGFVIENPAGIAIARVRFEVTARDESGTVLKSGIAQADWLAPGQRHGMAHTLFLSAGQIAASLSVELTEQSYRPTEPLIVENVRFVEERFASSVVGTVRNPYPRELESVSIVALLYDDADNIVGGESTYVRLVPAGGSASASAQVPDGLQPARVEMYAFISEITKFHQ